MNPRIDPELQNMIMQYLASACENCSSWQECPEDDCVIWNVEKLVLSEETPPIPEHGTRVKGLKNMKEEL